MKLILCVALSIVVIIFTQIIMGFAFTLKDEILLLLSLFIVPGITLGLIWSLDKSTEDK